MMEQHQKQQPIKKIVILEIREVSISKNTRLIKVNSHVAEKRKFGRPPKGTTLSPSLVMQTKDEKDH
jgi:hypothetical protein